MKIGIFGDSFVGSKMNPELSWPEIIATKYDTEIHGLSGSSLYYSIEKIKEYHERYDKIVLVTTFPGRIKIKQDIYCELPHERFVQNVDQAKRIIETELKKSSPNMLRVKAMEAAYNYFVYLQDFAYDEYIFHLMVDDIKSLRPDIIIINGFLESSKDRTHVLNNMNAIYSKENLYWKYKRGTLIDKRNCHMNNENNVIFAEKVNSWLHGTPVFIDPDDFVTTDDKEFYLMKAEQ